MQMMHNSSPKFPRYNILGAHISAINMEAALESFDDWLRNRLPHYVCVCPAHSVMSCYEEPDLREIYNQSGLTTPDGMAIVWLLKLSGYRQVSRVYGPDLMLAVCEQFLVSGCRHYFYGGAPGVAEKLAERLQKQFSGLVVAGVDSPPFRKLTEDEYQQAVDRIKMARPDIVWVGIGSPQQERWMQTHVDKLDVPVLVGVGAAFDFLSGTKPQAPLWIQRSGLEWLFRLFCEPHRLWRRYIKYPKFLWLVFLQKLGVKSF